MRQPAVRRSAGLSDERMMLPTTRYFRSLARRSGRAFWPLVIVVAGAVTCDSPTALRQRGLIAVEPVLSVQSLTQFAGLTVDQVRLTAIRPPAETLARRTFPFSADSSQVRATLDVAVSGTEQILVLIELLAASSVVFTGQQTVAVTAGATTPPAPTPIPVTYTGPGSSLAQIRIAPRDSGVTLGGQMQFRLTATDSANNPVAQFYASWTVRSQLHALNANGLFRAANQRGTVWVVAATPTGVVDSTTVTVSPVAVAVAPLSGNAQGGAPGTRLGAPLVARVTAADGGPVAGVRVAFAPATGGGAVDSASVLTDSAGRAGTTVTLGPSVGVNTFTATVTGLAPATFTATASNPIPAVITLVLADSLVGVGMSPPLTVRLTQPAPAGGLTVTVVSDSTAYLTVAAPGTIAFNAGDTLRTIAVTGVAAGVTQVRATAPGYTAGSLFLAVIPPFLSLPAAANVNVGSSASLAVQPRPRPLAALPVTLMSSDTAVVRVTTPTLNFAAGQASLNATVQGVAPGTAVITATAGGYLQGATVVTTAGAGVPTTLQKQAGDNQAAFINDTLPIRLQARVLDIGGAPVAGIQVLFAVATGGGTIGGGASVLATTNASGIAVATGAWRMGGTPGANSLTASLPAFPAVTAVTFNATGTLPPPQIVLNIFGSTVVGQARTGQLDVRLLQAAPAGGLTVNLATTRAGLLRIGSYASENGSVAFAQGDTLKSVVVFGDSTVTGVDTVIATATGYTPDTLAVPVSLNLISLPPTLNVPFNQAVSLPINLSIAAPAGGLKVAVTSTNPAAVQVLTDTVTVPQGSQVANASVLGVSLGTATVTATNPNYAPHQSAVTVTASLNILQTTVTPNASFGLPITVQLESGGLPIAAPAGGIPVTLTPRNTACVAAPSTTIPAGLVSVAALVTYGGSATLPCSSYLVASGPAGFAIDSVNVNMQPQPAVNINPSYLGSGLQRAFGGTLGAGNHGGTTVRVTSTNPSLFTLALTDSTPGAAFVDVPLNAGSTSFAYYVQVADGVSADSADMIATAAGFLPDTARLTVFTPVVDIIFLNSTGTTRTASDPFQVRLGSASSAAGPIGTEDVVRTGRAPFVISVVNDSVAVGDLVTTAGAADSVTQVIGPRQSRSPSTVATGGVEFDYVAAGVARVRAAGAGLRSVGTAVGQNITVTAPVININPTFIGARLQRAVGGSLSAPAVAGDTVTLRTTRPGVLRISPNDSTGFADSIAVGLAAGASSFTYYIQGVDTILSDSVDVIATVPAFTADTARFTVHRPVFDIIFLNSTGNTRSANDAFQVRVGSPATAAGGLSIEDVLRFGHPAATFNVVNDSLAVGDLITSAGAADSVTVQIAARQSRSPSTVATGGVEFDYVAGGVARVRAHAADFRSVGAALGQTITVSAPIITISPTFIGARLQRAVSGSMSAAAVAGDTVTLRTTRPGVLRLSPNDSTGFADSIRIALTPGSSSFTWFIHGVDTVTADSVDVIATIPAFTADTARYSVFRPVFDIIFLNGTANTLAANDPFQVRLGSPGSATGGLASEDALRFGHAAVTATLATSQATVAQLVTTTTTGSSVTVNVAPRQSRSPTTVAAGGVELDYLTTGTTVVTAALPDFRVLSSDTQTVTVTAPFATVNPVTVGSGLQVGSSVSLSSANHGGISVVVRSSNPAVALVSPNFSTPGTDSIVVAVGAGSASFGYYVQGVEGLSGAPQQVTIRATAPGFTDGTATATVVQPAVDVIFLAASGAAAAADDPFQVRIGYANTPTNSAMSAEQELRAGAPGPLTVTIQSTNPAAGVLTTTAQPGASSVTVQIAAGQARSPSTVATGGVAFDFLASGVTRVVPTITGFITVQQTAPFTQPGFQVTVTP